ncbi:unnamed protein product [Psylliodes chrysocephalus]|uniref:Uncharacterized protein n=1 Tax=Psylliodes chrysocephalus TaxID=3402493 RepID=A0A9P0D947_9CUCU|nr:unnamed protein product [Psylliodes chrysocephala]
MDSQDENTNNSSENSVIQVDKGSNPNPTIPTGVKPKFKTLPLPSNVVTTLLDFKTNDYQIESNTITGADLPKVDLLQDNDSVDNTQTQGGPSSFRSEYEYALSTQKDTNLNRVAENIFREEAAASEDENTRSRRPSQTNPNDKTTRPKTTELKQAKSKITMPPIVIDGKTTNPKNLIQDIKAFAIGSFSIKHTNYTTVLFIDEKEDHEKVLANIKLDKMPYHTYTNNEDKSHAFVLRGLSEGTKITDIELDMEEQYEIKTRAIYKMKTKDRPLYLVITVPAITLDYLNRNARRVLYTRVVWEIRKSAKQIIQCHTCQERITIYNYDTY